MRRESAYANSLASLRRAAGVTLVELLVVIGIIALLMGMLMPTIVEVRRTADTATCASNMRQVALALADYELTFGVFPMVSDPSIGTLENDTWGLVNKTWVDSLADGHLGGLNIEMGQLGPLSCPTASHFDALPVWLGQMPHFGYNFYVHPPEAQDVTVGQASFHGKRSSFRAAGSEKILLADSKYTDRERGWYQIAGYGWVDLRHAGGNGLNITYADGHVELVRMSERDPNVSGDPYHPLAPRAFRRDVK